MRWLAALAWTSGLLTAGFTNAHVFSIGDSPSQSSSISFGPQATSFGSGTPSGDGWSFSSGYPAMPSLGFHSFSYHQVAKPQAQSTSESVWSSAPQQTAFGQTGYHRLTQSSFPKDKVTVGWASTSLATPFGPQSVTQSAGQQHQLQQQQEKQRQQQQQQWQVQQGSSSGTFGQHGFHHLPPATSTSSAYVSQLAAHQQQQQLQQHKQHQQQQTTLTAPSASSDSGSPVVVHRVQLPTTTKSNGPRVHEIITHSARQAIRLEEFSQPAQLIRVIEGPRGPPEVVQVHAPAEGPSLVRVLAKSGGPAHVERVVHRAPPQVINVHKPAPPPTRIIQVVRGQATAPHVEFHYEATPVHEVHIADAVPADVSLPPPVQLNLVAPPPKTITLDQSALPGPAGPVRVSAHMLPAGSPSGPRGPFPVKTDIIGAVSAPPPASGSTHATVIQARPLASGSTGALPPTVSPSSSLVGSTASAGAFESTMTSSLTGSASSFGQSDYGGQSSQTSPGAFVVIGDGSSSLPPTQTSFGSSSLAAGQTTSGAAAGSTASSSAASGSSLGGSSTFPGGSAGPGGFPSFQTSPSTAVQGGHISSTSSSTSSSSSSSSSSSAASSSSSSSSSTAVSGSAWPAPSRVGSPPAVNCD